jgi:hypothetical protein
MNAMVATPAMPKSHRSAVDCYVLATPKQPTTKDTTTMVPPRSQKGSQADDVPTIITAPSVTVSVGPTSPGKTTATRMPNAPATSGQIARPRHRRAGSPFLDSRATSPTLPARITARRVEVISHPRRGNASRPVGGSEGFPSQPVALHLEPEASIGRLMLRWFPDSADRCFRHYKPRCSAVPVIRVGTSGGGAAGFQSPFPRRRTAIRGGQPFAPGPATTPKTEQQTASNRRGTAPSALQHPSSMFEGTGRGIERPPTPASTRPPPHTQTAKGWGAYGHRERPPTGGEDPPPAFS